MGSRKRLSIERLKKDKKLEGEVLISLNKYPSSPRKMRLIADLIRNMNVYHALDILKYSKKEASNILQTLLWSGITNWQLKNQNQNIEKIDLYIKKITVNNGRMLKRLKPASQGRGHRIRKRSNHVTINISDRKHN